MSHFYDPNTAELHSCSDQDGIESNLYPSVTTILKMLFKEGLEIWKINEHIASAHQIARTRKKLPPLGQFQGQVKQTTRKRLSSSSRAGTRLHKQLENFFAGEELDPRYEELCMEIAATLHEKCGEQEWFTEVEFVSEYGFGGCIDLSSENWVVDAKSKEKSAKFKEGQMVFLEHHLQVGAYCLAKNRSKIRGGNIFVDLEGGQVEFVEHPQEILVTAQEIFLALVDAWWNIKTLQNISN